MLKIENDRELDNTNETSMLIFLFKVVGVVVLIIGVIGGYSAGELEYSFLDPSDRNWQLTLLIWVATIISSLFLFGFGKIIELLTKIVDHKE